jgi:hypothetical protein
MAFDKVRFASINNKILIPLFSADFLQDLLKKKDRKLAQASNSSFRYIDDVLSLNNSRLGDYLHFIKQLNSVQKTTVLGKNSRITFEL